jgi:exopolyphosphatase/guanosine-5'-triphosphate,3'-diphosphate pyrophosphatase
MKGARGLAKPAPASAGARPDGRFAVLDIGSNSVRLVVYDRLERVPVALFNEKALCGLGRGLEDDNRLDPRAMADALATVKRFAALARAMEVETLDAVATAAMRDAANGAAFVDEIERETGLAIRVLAGTEEARLSALGVLSAIPEADGVMGDLGGGSLELVPLKGGVAGEGLTLPIGPLRLGTAKLGKARDAIDQALAAVPWLGDAAGCDLYIVGGSWRALGRVHMARQNYPVHVLHGYAVEAAEMEQLALLLAGFGKESVKRIEGVPKERLETLPLAALTLARVLRAARSARVVFAA